MKMSVAVIKFRIYFIRYAALSLYKIIRAVHKRLDYPIYTHCIGHSLGAHVCAFTGKHLEADEDVKVKAFDRLSGLDPAGPLFANDVPYPFNFLNISSAARLNPNDAKLVDVIHTDGDARYSFVLTTNNNAPASFSFDDFYQQRK